MSDGGAKRARSALIVVIAGLAWFGALAGPRLVNPDEGRYTEVAREMAAGGDWLVPRLNGAPHWAKPPLTYWLAAGSLRLFGATEWAARLPSALGALLALAATWWIAARGLGRAGAVTALILLAGAAEFMALSHSVTTDMLTAAFTTLALAAWAAGFPGFGAPSTPQLPANLVAFAALGLGFLTKGPVPLAIFAVTLLAFGLLTRTWRLIPLSHLAVGLVIAASIGLPWFLLVASRNPDLYDFFLRREVHDRYLTHEHGRAQAWWYLPTVLLLGLLPWAPFFVAAMAKTVRAGLRARRGGPPLTAIRWFAVAWVVGPFLLFWASGSQLWTYVLPLFPGAAMLVASAEDRSAHAGGPTPRDRLLRRLTIVFALLVFGLAGFAPRFQDSLGRTAPLCWVAARLPADIVGATLRRDLHPTGAPPSFAAGHPRLITWRMTVNSLGFYVLGLRPEYVPPFGEDTSFEIEADKVRDRKLSLTDLALFVAAPDDTFIVLPEKEIAELARAGISSELIEVRPTAFWDTGDHSRVALVRCAGRR